MTEITVLVVEDHPLVRAGCQKLLSRRPNLTLLEASTGRAGLDLNQAHLPALIILDVNLPDMSGFDLLAGLIEHNPEVRIIVLSMYSDPPFVSRALAAGVRGYVTKNDDPESLLTAVDRVLCGEIYLGQIVAQKLALAAVAPERNGAADLTEKEQAVLDALALGKSLTEISFERGASYKTIANTTATIRKKLGLRSNMALVKYAIERNS